MLPRRLRVLGCGAWPVESGGPAFRFLAPPRRTDDADHFAPEAKRRPEPQGTAGHRRRALAGHDLRAGAADSREAGRRPVAAGGSADSPRGTGFSADLALSRAAIAGDLATEVGVLEAPQEVTGRLTVDDNNLLGGDCSAGSGHPSPGK